MHAGLLQEHLQLQMVTRLLVIPYIPHTDSHIMLGANCAWSHVETHCRWDKHVVIYGEAPIKKDHPIVNFLIKDAHAKSVLYLKTTGCAIAVSPTDALKAAEGSIVQAVLQFQERDVPAHIVSCCGRQLGFCQTLHLGLAVRKLNHGHLQHYFPAANEEVQLAVNLCPAIPA